MRKPRKNSGLWAYLEEKGVLASGSDEAISEAKREYWKSYHYQHRKEQRTAKPEFVVSLSREDGTHERIKRAAAKHHLTIPSFLRTATLAYLEQVYVVPDRAYLAELEQLLSECVNEIQALADTKEKYFWQREHKLENIERKIGELEERFAELCRYPLLLEDFVRREVNEKPELRDKLITLLQTDDRKGQIT